MGLTQNPSAQFEPTTPGDVAHQVDHDQINPMLQPVLDAQADAIFRKATGGVLKASPSTEFGRALVNRVNAPLARDFLDVWSRAQGETPAGAQAKANAARDSAISSAKTYTDAEVQAARDYADGQIAAIVAAEGWTFADPIEWDAGTEYPPRQVVDDDGGWFVSLTTTVGDKPTTSPTKWGPIPTAVDADFRSDANDPVTGFLRVRDGSARVDLPVNPLSSPYADSVVVDGLVHPLSEGYTTLEDAQAVYPHVTSLTQTFDWAVIQQAIDDGRAVDLPEVDIEAGHRYLVNGPVLLRTKGAALLGRGAGSWLHNFRDDSTANAGAVVTLHAGLFHPAMWQHNGGNMNQDPVDAITYGDTSVTLSGTPSQTLEVGQVVLVFDETPGPTGLVGNGMINKIVAITGASNEVIHLEYPLARTWTTPCYISDGRGHQFGGYTALDTTYESHLVEGVRVENMAVSSEVNNWLNRDAVLRGRFRNLSIPKTLALIYGNAKGDCTFENITGVYEREFSEVAQCGHSNRATNITARSHPSAPPTSQVAVRMGLGGVLDGFDITDGVERNVRFISAQERQQLRNGTIRLTGSVAEIARFNGTRDSLIENVDIHWKNALTGTAFIAGLVGTPTVRPTMRDVRLFPPNSDTYDMLRFTGTVDDALVEGLQAPGGIVSSSGATLTGRMDRSRIHGLDTATWTAHAKNLVGAGNVFDEWVELERLRRDSATGLTVTQTTKSTPTYRRTLGKLQKTRNGNVLNFVCLVIKTGTEGSQRLQLVLSDLTVADLTLPGPTTGMFRLDGGITSEAGSGITRLYWWTFTHPDGVTERDAAFVAGGTEPFPAGANLDLWGWKANTSDTMTVRRFGFLPDFALA